jgi:hypothetical protein
VFCEYTEGEGGVAGDDGGNIPIGYAGVLAVVTGVTGPIPVTPRPCTRMIGVMAGVMGSRLVLWL